METFHLFKESDIRRGLECYLRGEWISHDPYQGWDEWWTYISFGPEGHQVFDGKIDRMWESTYDRAKIRTPMSWNRNDWKKWYRDGLLVERVGTTITYTPSTDKNLSLDVVAVSSHTKSRAEMYFIVPRYQKNWRKEQVVIGLDVVDTKGKTVRKYDRSDRTRAERWIKSGDECQDRFEVGSQYNMPGHVGLVMIYWCGNCPECRKRGYDTCEYEIREA